MISVETDVLFRPEQQVELAKCLPSATYIALDSPDGHDGFLLEFKALNGIIRGHLEKQCPWIYAGSAGVEGDDLCIDAPVNSVFGEAEETAIRAGGKEGLSPLAAVVMTVVVDPPEPAVLVVVVGPFLLLLRWGER